MFYSSKMLTQNRFFIYKTGKCILDHIWRLFSEKQHCSRSCCTQRPGIWPVEVTIIARLHCLTAPFLLLFFSSVSLRILQLLWNTFCVDIWCSMFLADFMCTFINLFLLFLDVVFWFQTLSLNHYALPYLIYSIDSSFLM